MNEQLMDDAAQRLARRAPTATPIRTGVQVSFEFFPPASPEGLDALASASCELAQYSPNFVSVTYGAGGSNQTRTFEALDRLASLPDLPLAGHLTSVAATKAHVQGVVDAYRRRGLTRVVALRGDTPDGHDSDAPSGYGSAADLVAGIRARTDGADFDVSVGCYPEVHPKATSAAADLDNLKAKIDAGADRAITQYFFEADVYLRFLERARAAGITVPIVPGIMPVTNYAGICRFSDRCGTAVPAWAHDLFGGLDEAPEIRELVAATVAAELCRRLVDHGIRDFHFYTMNRPNLTAATCRILGVPPVPPAASTNASRAS